MDYDGFHQIVLVTDLKGMNMVDVTEIKPNHIILNTVVEKAKLSDQMDDIFYRQFFQQIQINNNIRRTYQCSITFLNSLIINSAYKIHQKS